MWDVWFGRDAVYSKIRLHTMSLINKIQVEPDKFYKTLSLTKHKEEVEECNVALSLLCCQQPTIFCSSAKICLPEVHYFEVSSFHFLSCTTLFINTFSEWVHTKRYYLWNVKTLWEGHKIWIKSHLSWQNSAFYSVVSKQFFWPSQKS